MVSLVGTELKVKAGKGLVWRAAQLTELNFRQKVGYKDIDVWVWEYVEMHDIKQTVFFVAMPRQ